MSVSLQVLFWR